MSANKSLEKKFFHPVENVIKQLVHTSCVRSSRYEALGKFKEHSRTNEPIVKWTRYKTRHAVIFKTHASCISQMRKKLNRAIFKWESMVIRDCFAFSSLRSVMGPEKLAPLSQPIRCKTKDLVARVFPRVRQFGYFF